jgi:hypothetical protein
MVENSIAEVADFFPLGWPYVATQLFAELPKGDGTLISAKEIGSAGIEFRHAKIEDKESQTLITSPYIGTAELDQSDDGKEFYAVFTQKKVTHEGKEYDDLRVTIFSGSINNL